MRVEYDPAKNERNIRERGLSFERAAEFDFDGASVGEVERHGETRFVAAGYLDGRLHVLCYRTIPDGIRVISFRKANEREALNYGRSKTIGQLDG